MKIGKIRPLDNTDWSSLMQIPCTYIELSFLDSFPKNKTFWHIDSDGFTFRSENCAYFAQIRASSTISRNSLSKFTNIKAAREELKEWCRKDIYFKIKNLKNLLKFYGCNRIYTMKRGEPQFFTTDPLGAIGCNGYIEIAIFGYRESSLKIYGKSFF